MTHELRRADREITDPAEIEAILAEGKYATIALADGDEPYVVTLSCGYDSANQRLVFHCAPAGRKLDIIAVNPKASATVIRDKGYLVGECAHPFDSVVMTGTMRLAETPEETRQAMSTLIKQLDPADAAAIWERNAIGTDEGLKRFRMLIFQIEEWSAKTGQ